MKATKITYWVITALFALFMAWSGVMNIMVDQGSIDLIATTLKFPEYIIPFLGWAKVIGAIAILVPGFPRIKEWAYAGLFFDLAGATYASIIFNGALGGVFMGIFLVFHLASYFLYHKYQKMTNQPVVA
jgi:hypothetical protein